MDSRHFHVLNLGAGVQSTALYLMFHRGQIAPQIDVAIFADTQDEPGAVQRRLGLPDPEGSVYAHLDWLGSLGGPTILVRTKGRLSSDLERGVNSTGQRFASIPAYTIAAGATKEGQIKRQCSKEYKVEVIQQTIRREICGAAPKRRIAKGIVVTQYIGISADEFGRAVRVMRNGVPKSLRQRADKWGYGQLKDFFSNRQWRYSFPLVDGGATREDCVGYLKPIVPHKTPRSACVFCPYHDDLEWDRLKREDQLGYAEAARVDGALRIPGNIVNRGLDQPMFLHRSCKPLDLIKFDTTPKPPKAQQAMNFSADCLGVCGV